jgi:hypothetical protein
MLCIIQATLSAKRQEGFLLIAPFFASLRNKKYKEAWQRGVPVLITVH